MTPLQDVLERAHRLGFLGPGPVDPHVDHARAFARAVPAPPAQAADLGSGGGVPALVLAIEEWPDSLWWLIESRERRAAFLVEAVTALEASDRITVLHQRAEDVGNDPQHRAGCDLVTARSFGAPPVTAECAAGLLRVGGRLVVSEPPVATSNRWPRAPLAQLGLEPEATSEGPPRLQVLRLVTPCPTAFPRESGRAKRRPLWS
ncbi:MAG: class I SAM-dependent methyltransferase [Acidimicrobiales bacterium]|nr:class I SAM-dependent methyltransferase [Acidimicrobiales bacterium]